MRDLPLWDGQERVLPSQGGLDWGRPCCDDPGWDHCGPSRGSGGLRSRGEMKVPWGYYQDVKRVPWEHFHLVVSLGWSRVDCLTPAQSVSSWLLMMILAFVLQGPP